MLLLAGGPGSAAVTRPEAPRLDAEIARQVERALAGKLGLRGLEPLRGESGELLAGETRSFEVELRRGEQFLAVGACDEACGDLDLELADFDGMPSRFDYGPDAFPAVGAIIAKGGRYTLRVAMPACSGRCRFAVVLLVRRLDAGPDARDRLDEAMRAEAMFVAPILREAARAGRRLEPLERFHQPSLGGGHQESFPVEVARAGMILAVAACDFGCNDIDLLVEDPAGAVLGRDLAPDPEASLWLYVPKAGTYRVTVRMEHCVEEPCAYAAAVMADVPDVPVLGSRGGQGTCFAVRPDGLVATVAHVVAGADALDVHLADGTVFAAHVHAIDLENDLAVLRIPHATPSYLPLAPPDTATLGLRVFAIAFPAVDILGSDAKYGEGVVAGLGGFSGSRSAQLQVTVPIQPGSSGGALVTERGDAVGVLVSSVGSDSFEEATGQPPQSLNYAVRAEHLARLLPAAAGEPAPVDRAHAIERARAAACWIDAVAAPSDPPSRAAAEPEERWHSR